MKLHEISFNDVMGYDVDAKESDAEIKRATEDARDLPSFKALIKVVPEHTPDRLFPLDRRKSKYGFVFGPLKGLNRIYYFRTGPDGQWQKFNQAHRTSSWVTAASAKRASTDIKNALKVYDATLDLYDFAFKEILRQAEFEIKQSKDPAVGGTPD